MITRHVAALEQIRKLSPYRDITDPAADQRNESFAPQCSFTGTLSTQLEPDRYWKVTAPWKAKSPEMNPTEPARPLPNSISLTLKMIRDCLMVESRRDILDQPDMPVG